MKKHTLFYRISPSVCGAHEKGVFIDRAEINFNPRLIRSINTEFILIKYDLLHLVPSIKITPII